MLTKKVARRLTAAVERLCSDKSDSPSDGITASPQQTLATLLRAPVPSSLFAEEELPSSRGLCAKVAGFWLHAGQWVRAEDRETLERLLRYGLRGRSHRSGCQGVRMVAQSIGCAVRGRTREA